MRVSYLTTQGNTVSQSVKPLSGYIYTDKNTYYNENATIGLYYPYYTDNDRQIENHTIPRYIEVLCHPGNIIDQQGVTNYLTNIDNRIGSVVSNYSYGDTVYNNTQIVNEGAQTVYNPATGETHNIENWQYDYSDRSYNVTTTSGDNIVITYGDEYLTINEGGTVYNINYYIYEADPDSDGGGGSGTTPAPSPPPSGGNNGNGNNGGNGILDTLLGGLVGILTSIFGALINFVVGIIGEVVKGLGAFFGLITQLLLEIPLLFAGFTAFLAAVFPFLPAEFMMVVTFGIILIIVAAVIKKIFG